MGSVLSPLGHYIEGMHRRNKHCVQHTRDHGSRQGNDYCSCSYKNTLVVFLMANLLLLQAGALVGVGRNTPKEWLLKPQSIVAARHWRTDDGGLAHHHAGSHCLFPVL